MAKLQHIEHRMLNWARWKLRAGGVMLGYASPHYSESVGGGGGYREAVIPVSDCDAAETDAAVAQLVSHLKATCEVHYLSVLGHKDQARHLCCSQATLYSRIDEAHRRIAAHFTARQERVQHEQERIAALNGRPVHKRKEFYEL